MKNRKPVFLLSFDMEEFDLPEEYGVAVSENERIKISKIGAGRILDVLDKTGIHATMFITEYFAERCPELVQRMVKSGHEIASHGMNHTRFEPADLKKSREYLEKITGKPVTGFRMARLVPVSKEEILRAGYEYESSENPVWIPGRYNNLRKPLLPYRESCGLIQYPVSAVPLFRIPLFWLSFKNFPLPVYKMLAKCAIKGTGYFNIYSHPWEYCASAADPQWKIPGYLTRHAGMKMEERLKNLILYLKKSGDFMTFQEAVSQKFFL